MSTFQVVLVPTIVGVAANELFPKVCHRSSPQSNGTMFNADPRLSMSQGSGEVVESEFCF